MTSAVEMFNDPVLDELAQFAANNQNAGPRWNALHGVLSKRVLPAREAFRAALDTAAKEKVALENRQADARNMREAIAAQLIELDHYLAEQVPAETAAAGAASARISRHANESLTENEIKLVASAIQNFLPFRA